MLFRSCLQTARLARRVTLRRLPSASLSSAAADDEVIVRSRAKVPELTSPVAKLPLATFILQDFLKPGRRDQVAIMDGMSGATVTFEEVYTTSHSLADSLEALGVKKGDRVAVLSPNHLHYMTVFMGISLCGAVSTCMNPLSSEKEMTYQINKTAAHYVFVHPMCLAMARRVLGEQRIIVMDTSSSTPSTPSGTPSDTPYEGMQRLSALISSAPRDALRRMQVPQGFDPHGLLTIPFSSGTTGTSKGVMLTHCNLVSNVLQLMPFEGNYLKATATLRRGTLLVPLPFFHIYGLVAGLLTAAHTGAKLIFMPAFDLQRFLELIQTERVTRAFVVPPIVLALAKHPMVAQYDLSSVDCFMSGAAPLGQEVQVAAAERLGCLVKQAWGMTEISPCGTITPDFMVSSVAHLHGTSGQLAPGTEAKIVDPLTGADLPYSQTGELLIRGPQVMKGYLDDPAATSNCIRPDGWLHTGDIAHFDDQGWLYITDRLKELIKYKGLQVPPAELEAVILSMKDVKDAIVIPVPDAEAGELPRAYVVKQDGASLTAEAVAAYVSDHVAPYKRLRGGVFFVDAVPKSPSGKLLRRVMIDIDRQQAPAADS